MVIVEDGTGILSANSYISADDAETYLNTFYTGLSISNDHVVEATRQIDALYGSRYRGSVQSQPGVEQGLLWPRTEFIDAYGYTISAGTMPIQLVHMTAQIARLVSLGLNTISVENANVKSKSESVEGAVSVSTEYRIPNTSRPHDEFVSIIAPLLEPSSASPFVTYRHSL